MRLVFLYVMHSSGRFYSQRVREEGYFDLLRRMVEQKIVDEVLVVVHSNKDEQVVYPEEKISGVIVKDLGDLKLREDDVIWCRGGFRAWHDVLKKWGDDGHWLINYAANTGRERWLFWDVIFNDLSPSSYVDRAGRFNLSWIKPILPSLFFPVKDAKISFNICIGSSFIHDKKAQWKVIDALVAYKEKYGVNLKSVLPGGFRGGVKSNLIPEKIKKHNLHVALPGMVKREVLNQLYNETKLYIHLGGGGQNDRGPLEALRCGCCVLLETPKRHAPFLANGEGVVRIARNPSDPAAIADDIHDMLTFWSMVYRESAFNFFDSNCNTDKVIIPQMSKLFDVLKSYKRPCPECFKGGVC